MPATDTPGRLRVPRHPRARVTGVRRDDLASTGAEATADRRDDWPSLLARSARGTTLVRHGRGDTIFLQGQPADSLFFLLQGKARLSVTTGDGKEAIVATLSTGMFFGEGCLAGQDSRIATAIALEECALTKVDKMTMARLLHEEPGLAAVFVRHLLARVMRYEADFIDQMFNSSEKRLARMLLLLSHFGPNSTSEPVVAGISQEHLAQMVGTTRSRINVFMNRFRTLGYIDYSSADGLTVHRTLLDVLKDDLAQ